MKRLLCLFVVGLVSGWSVRAGAQSPWDGTWRLNPTKSQMTGATVSYSRNETGMLHFSNGGAVSYDFACDGKAYKTVANKTMSCRKFSNFVYDTSSMVDGHLEAVSHRVISDDGRTMTVSTNGEQPNGTVFNDRNTYKRISGTAGIVGTWRNVRSTSSNPDVQVVKIEGGVMHTSFPGYEDKVDAKMDGSESPFTGPTLPPGVTVSLKVEGPRRFHLVQKLDGKVLGESTQTLSVDGRVLTEVSWTPGKTGERQTFVYDKE